MKAKGFGLFMTVLIAMTIGFGIGAFVGHGCVDIEERCDTIVRTDTVHVEKPVAKDSVIVRTERVYLKVSAEPTLTEKNYAQISADSIRDSVMVEVPIEQKVYEDSTYKAWVSGYMPSLDSINVYQRTEVITVTKFQKPKKWSLGIGAGASLGTDGKIRPSITVGVQRSLFDF